MKADIKTVGNMIGGRQGWAYICNSGKFPVLKVDLDAKQEYEDFKKYGGVRVAYSSPRYSGFHEGQLCKNTCDGKDRYEVMSGGCCISNRFDYYDALELINNANLPVVTLGQVVAIAEYGKTAGATLKLFKVDRVDVHCSTVATFAPLTDEEMAEVVKDTNRWLNR